MKEPIIRPKSWWQKGDCVFCHEPATLEALFSASTVMESTIRCCTKLDCQRKAKELAVLGTEAFSEKPH